jgi:phosphate starvation-inducible protein PhoH
VLDVSNDVAAELASIGDGILEALRERLKINILLRGNRLTIAGDDVRVAEARAVVDELVELVETGQEIGPATVDAVVKALDQAENVQDVFGDVVWRHRGKQITPKTVTQKRYVEAIRNCTVTFGIGPAGTGKTYLAMALAVAALQDRQVARIILTRPAVEAGERLGFLPGDLLAKVDPYLRPLFDALYDMLDAERPEHVHGARHGRGRAAGLHARSSAAALERRVDAERFSADRESAGRRPRHRVRRAADACHRRLPTGQQACVSGVDTGRGFHALLRRAPLARLHA